MWMSYRPTLKMSPTHFANMTTNRVRARARARAKARAKATTSL